MPRFNVYEDIAKRTNGEVYIGVVGPVRSGKSTFIKNFMELSVLPEIKDENMLKRTKDEMPQSAAGKMIMTTEPKFVPSKGVKIKVGDNTDVSVRLIDCVGYLVDGANGHMEEDGERMVKTPWFDYDIPFSKAAKIGTKKVIDEHSTVGIVVTNDGSFGEIPREKFIESENKTIDELKELGKPFIVLLNSSKPNSEQTKKIAKEINETKGVTVIPINIALLKQEDVHNIMNSLLNNFKISEIGFRIPKWIEMLGKEHGIKNEIIANVREILSKMNVMNDVCDENLCVNSGYIMGMNIAKKDMSSGYVEITIDVDEKYYFQIVSEMAGTTINNEYELINTIRELKGMKEEYSKIKDAMEAVNQKGYGVVIPSREEIMLEEPEIIKNGNKFGIKIKACAPSIHMIKADVLTEIAPIVGSEEQANDLIGFIHKNSEDKEGMWKTNIFGKSIEEIVYDGISLKINRLSDETREKMQDTISKITNESRGGVICIIL